MIEFFTAPGRIEISGNHTDHQHGCVLAAAIDLEIKCSAQVNDSNIVNIVSEGYGNITVDLTDLSPHIEEHSKPGSLVRGIAA